MQRFPELVKLKLLHPNPVVFGMCLHVLQRCAAAFLETPEVKTQSQVIQEARDLVLQNPTQQS